MKPVLLTTTCALALALGACSTPTPVGIKPGDVPSAFTAPIPANVAVWPQTGWWKTFSNTELAGLEDKAQTDNLDLAVAEADVLQAQAQTGVVQSTLFPDIGVSGNA